MIADFIIILGQVSEYNYLKKVLEEESSIDSILIKGENIALLEVKKLIISNIKLLNTDICCRFINTMYLNLSFNELIDISPITRTMLALQVLDISHNKLSTINDIQSLIYLEVLRCQYNQLTSLEPISFLIHLSELWIAHNEVNWTELIFLASLRNLKLLAIDGTPIDQKDKHMDFLLSLCPSVKCVDGRPVKQASLAVRSGFLKTAVGRTMLVHARSTYPKNQRIKNILLDVQRRGIVQGGMDECELPIDQPQYQDQFPVDVDVNVDVDVLALSEACTPTIQVGPIVKGSNTTQQSMFDPKAGRNLGSVSAAAVVIPTDQPSHLPASSTTLHLPYEGRTTSRVKQLSTEESGMRTSRSEGAIGVTAAHSMDAHSAACHVTSSQATKGNCSQGLAPLVEKVVVRFGNSSESPIALCLYSDGSGYMRWSRNGCMACSMEGGRLLASYQSGSAAVVMDRHQGSGTVVDPRGNCVLSVSASGAATEMDQNKKWLASYKRRSGGASAPNAGDDVVQRIWKFEGLEIVFQPSTWEIIVRINSTRLRCEFSSISGGRVLEEFHVEVEESADDLQGQAQKPPHTSRGSGKGKDKPAVAANERKSQPPKKAQSTSPKDSSISTASSTARPRELVKPVDVQDHQPVRSIRKPVSTNGGASAVQSTNGVADTVTPTNGGVSAARVVERHEVDHTALRSDLSSMVTGLDDLLSGLLKR